MEESAWICWYNEKGKSSSLSSILGIIMAIRSYYKQTQNQTKGTIRLFVLICTKASCEWCETSEKTFQCKTQNMLFLLPPPIPQHRTKSRQKKFQEENNPCIAGPKLLTDQWISLPAVWKLWRFVPIWIHRICRFHLLLFCHRWWGSRTLPRRGILSRGVGEESRTRTWRNECT